jgi:hypothetical protein
MIIDAWNECAKKHGYKHSEGAPAIRHVIQLRLKNEDFAAGAIEQIHRLRDRGPHPFLKGLINPTFKASLTWFCRPHSWGKIVDGDWDVEPVNGPQFMKPIKPTFAGFEE